MGVASPYATSAADGPTETDDLGVKRLKLAADFCPLLFQLADPGSASLDDFFQFAD
jgi:hypothetical protein